jgi:hypothetical protein
MAAEILRPERGRRENQSEQRQAHPYWITVHE